MSREVREHDLRMPEFKGAKLEDLEFRDDGAIVRKDRWETALRNIAGILLGSRSKFECQQVVDEVHRLVGPEWCTIPAHEDFDSDYFPEDGAVVEVKAEDGSVLRNVTYRTVTATANGTKHPTWAWAGDHSPVAVIAWREQQEQEQEA